MSDPTYACSLDPAALDARRGAWRALDADLVERRRAGGRATTVYRRRPELVAALHRLVRAEAECCPFLRMTVHEEPDRVRLEVEAPPGAGAALPR